MLDFPDEVNFGLCPVKHTSTKTLLVRNVGEKEAKFTLSAQKYATALVHKDIGPNVTTCILLLS